MRPKVCVVCGDALAIGTRADHRYCGVNCRVRAHHLRRGVGTRQARNDRRVRVLEATIERMKRERETALTEADRVRGGATATPRRPVLNDAPRRAGLQPSSPTEDRLRELLRAARGSNAEKAQEIADLQRIIEIQRNTISTLKSIQPSAGAPASRQQKSAHEERASRERLEDLAHENAKLKEANAALDAAVARAAEETKLAAQKAKQQAEEEYRTQRAKLISGREAAEQRAKGAEDALKRDQSLLKTVGTVALALVATKAQDIEARRIEVESQRLKVAPIPTDEHLPVEDTPPRPTGPAAAASAPSRPRSERAPPLDDLAAWDALRRAALAQRWMALTDPTCRMLRTELQAESAVAEQQKARGLPTTARFLQAGSDGDRQVQIAALQARWSFIESPPPGWNKPVRWDQGRYRLDLFSETEVRKLSSERRTAWERMLRA